MITFHPNRHYQSNMLNIIRKNGIRYELHTDRINELKNNNTALNTKITGKRHFFTTCTEEPPRKKIKQDSPTVEHTRIVPMPIMEILESAKCVVCHDIYEQPILDRNCKQAICLPCYEKIIKNECPVCRDELDLIKLPPDPARAVTKAIAKCDLMRELDEDETQEAAQKHIAFYQGHYQLRSPATFDSQYDPSDDSSVSSTTSSASESNSSDSDNQSSPESESSDNDDNYSDYQADDSQSSTSDAETHWPDSENDSSDKEPDTHDCLFSPETEDGAAAEPQDPWLIAAAFLFEVSSALRRAFCDNG